MSQIGVQLTDSAYAVVNMRIMARIGLPVFKEIDKQTKRVVPCMHSRRRAAEARAKRRAVAVQPRQVHRPFSGDSRDLELWIGLRRQCPAGQKMLRPAHRLKHRTRRRLDGRAHAHSGRRGSQRREDLCRGCFSQRLWEDQLCHAYPAGPFPGEWMESLDGRRRYCLDATRIAKGRLHAINPETGFFGVAPGTSVKTNPNAMAALAKNTIFTNVASDAGGRRLVGRNDRRTAGRVHSIGKARNGHRRSPGKPEPRPRIQMRVSRRRPRNARRSIPLGKNPDGVPISAIIFGGRRATHACRSSTSPLTGAAACIWGLPWAPK